MWIDTRTEFSDSQELTVTTASTNVVDTGQNARNIGRGNPLYLVVQTEDDADNADGNEQYVVTLQSAAAEDFSGAKDLVSFEIPNTATAGTRFVTLLPQDNDRFLRLNYTLGGTSPSVTVNAFISNQEPPNWQAHPDAVN
mgnify:CR=1 FL=1